VRKETGRRLRVYQFWPKVLNLARENLRGLDGQKPGFRSKARRVFRPVCPRPSLSQLNFIWGRKTSVDSEISIVDFLGAECRKYRQRESKKKRINSAHKDYPRRRGSVCSIALLLVCLELKSDLFNYRTQLHSIQKLQRYPLTVQRYVREFKKRWSRYARPAVRRSHGEQERGVLLR
jgi:hypothetical protein